VKRVPWNLTHPDLAPLARFFAPTNLTVAAVPLGETYRGKEPYVVYAHLPQPLAGPVVALLRGGPKASEILHFLAHLGLNVLELWHIRSLPEKDDLFYSELVPEALEMFSEVKVRSFPPQPLERLLSQQPAGLVVAGRPRREEARARFCARLASLPVNAVVDIQEPLPDFSGSEGPVTLQHPPIPVFPWNSFPLSQLLRRKRSQGLKVAAALPTLNEEATVAKALSAALEVKAQGLLDEVFVVDSASTDRTAEIATGLGVPVYQAAGVGPELPPARGKGENLYKSLFLTDADIILWVDTDIETITPSFFTAPLAPLFAGPGIQLVKGFFKRPVRVTEQGTALGGGRVTELLVKPFLNLHYPGLASLVQPLSGVTAIRRRAAEEFFFPDHYGVEIALLLQAYRRWGPQALAQVDVGEVIHKSKSLEGLTEMSFQILQTVRDLDAVPTPGRRQDLFLRAYDEERSVTLVAKALPISWRPPKSALGAALDRGLSADGVLGAS
jgi:glycosyltransferase involved in cell wall biosynthesis